MTQRFLYTPIMDWLRPKGSSCNYLTVNASDHVPMNRPRSPPLQQSIADQDLTLDALRQSSMA